MEKIGAMIRGFKRKKDSPDNIFLAGVQKTGSQWIKQVFSDQRMMELTGMTIYPQHHYDAHEFHVRFPRNAIVPGLYVSYRLYHLMIEKPQRYKTIYVLRDPRNLVVSWFYSMRKTHPENAAVRVTRHIMAEMDQDAAISYSIKMLGTKFADMRSWVELGCDDENVLIVKLENITSNPDEFGSLFSFCGLDVSKSLRDSLFNDYSKDNMRAQDLAGRSDKSESHYRLEGSQHQEVFTPAHYTQFKNTTGNLVELLGYDS